MRIRTITAAGIIAAAIGGGCSEQAEPPSAPAETARTAEAAETGRDAAYAAAQGEPEAFVRALYAAYAAPAAEPPAPGRDFLLQRTLNAMIGADSRQARAAGREPYLREDPVCGCAGGEVVLTSVQVRPVDPTHAEADVAFAVDGAARRQTLKLEREGGRWKVADVLRPGEKPLTERLLAVID